jgi:predicted nucleic acid-binding protein
MSGNNAKSGLLDSNVIIYASKGELDLEHLMRSYSSLYVSIISYVEVAGYRFEDEAEEAAVLAILAQISTLNLDMEMAQRAIAYRKKRKIKLPDALILATASQVEADLLTFNLKDFQGLDDQVELVLPNKKEKGDLGQ